MDTTQLAMFFHLIGFGLLATMNVSGWLLNAQYRKAADYKSKLIVLSSARAIGLLSPLAIGIVLLTGIANMMVRGLGFTTEVWLEIKVILFLIAATNGVLFAIRSKKRGGLVAQLAQGSAPGGSEATLASMDRLASVFNIVQSVLLISILILTVWKPGRF
ncbi:MAG: hypothetical protein HY961_12685 [Ignavibacteriae bacterium]|nr:hypothetical protein [Ignavibacteriota bacterium]